MTLTPSRGKNHSFPFALLATSGVYPVVRARLLTPSELSKTVLWIIRFGSVTHASISVPAMRTKPQDVYSQNEWASSCITQKTVSQGNPFWLVSVATRPFFTRLSPPSVAAHSVPSESRLRLVTMPSPSPSRPEYDSRTLPSLKYATPPCENPSHRPPGTGPANRAIAQSFRPSLAQGIRSTTLSPSKCKRPCCWSLIQRFPELSPAMECNCPPGAIKANTAVTCRWRGRLSAT